MVNMLVVDVVSSTAIKESSLVFFLLDTGVLDIFISLYPIYKANLSKAVVPLSRQKQRVSESLSRLK